MSGFPIALRPRAQALPKWFDLARLQEIRDRHQHLVEQGRRASEKWRGAVQEVARLKAEMSLAPQAAQLMRRPTAEILRLSIEDLTEAKIDARSLQRLGVLEERAAELQAESTAMAILVQRSAPYAQRVEAFAREHRL
jgi:hypothetical protein